MRKLSSNAIGLLLFITIVFISCKKTNNDFVSELNEKATITSQSFSNQVQYAEKNLKKIAIEIAKLTDDPAFVNFVHTEANKKFDKEYEVLIEDLKKNSAWSNKLNSKDLNEGIDAFKNISGENGGDFYPQIYLPKMQNDEDLNNNFTSINNSTNLNDTIFFIAYGGGEPTVDQSFPAYYKDANDSLIYWGLMDESFAIDHEVWILSLNELKQDQSRLTLPLEPCINEYGEPIPCPSGTLGGGSGGGGTSSSSTNVDPTDILSRPHPDMGTKTPVNSKIENMSIRHHNETWVSGGSEVCIRAKLNCHNNRTEGNSTLDNEQFDSDQKSNYLGRFICKFKRRQVNNGTIVNVDYPLQTLWPTQSSITAPIYFDYVIFERDVWPANRVFLYRQGRTDPTTGNTTVTWPQWYRSEDDAYTFGTICNTPGLGGTFYNNDQIFHPGYFIYFTTKSF